MTDRTTIREQIVDLCRNNPEGLHRLVILRRIPAATFEDIDALFDAGQLAKIGGAPTLFVVPPLPTSASSFSTTRRRMTAFARIERSAP